MILVQPQPYAEGSSVGQSQLTTLIGGIAGFAQLVADVLQPGVLVVGLNRKDFLQHALDTLHLALVRVQIVLQKCLVAGGLDLGQVGRFGVFTAAAEIANFSGFESALRGSCHGAKVLLRDWVEQTRTSGLGGRRAACRNGSRRNRDVRLRDRTAIQWLASPAGARNGSTVRVASKRGPGFQARDVSTASLLGQSGSGLESGFGWRPAGGKTRRSARVFGWLRPGPEPAETGRPRGSREGSRTTLARHFRQRLPHRP